MTQNQHPPGDVPSQPFDPAGWSGDRMLSILSHELRIPANSIIGLSELLQRGPLDDRQRRLTAMIHQAGQTLLRLVNDVLDLSRLEAGQLRPEAVCFDLRTVVEEALEMLAAQAEAKGLALLQDLPPSLPTALVGDPNRLRQVLVNLLDNGVKFTQQGEVMVRARCVEASCEQVHLELEVRDTGVGIPEAEQQAVFDPFSKISAATASAYGGSGLGLSIVRRVVELMEGDIHLDSRPGQGARFVIRLRLNRQAAPLPPPREGLVGQAVLVVDGNATGRELLRRQLLAWGMTVRVCASAAEIDREAVGLDSPILVLLNLPPAESIALARQLGAREDQCLEPIPLLPLSWVGSKVHGGWRLTRPARQEQLYHTLLSAVAGERRAARSGTALGRRYWRARLLLAEDDPINRELTQIMLRDLGCEVLAVENGRQLIEALDQDTYDLIFMDYRMPMLDGLQATAAIRGREGSRHTPIVALTAHVTDGFRERCLAVGMDDFLGKPIVQEQLRAMLARWLPIRVGDCPVPVAVESAVTPIAAGPPLDRLRLETIRGLQSPEQPDLLGRVIDIWHNTAPRLRHELEQGYQQGNGLAVRDAAHTLASASGTVGALGLVTCCRRVEAAAAGSKDLDAAIAELLLEFQRVTVALSVERETIP